ncbi:MAG: DUF2851 family protein [bacterium]
MELKVHDREIILQKLWKSRKLLSQKLQTLSGKAVEVLYVGSENLDAGPDFKGAIIKIGGVLLKGDIEVHLSATGWYEHHHHVDPGYNGVILHLVSEEPQERLFIEREDGVRVEQLCVTLDRESLDLWRQQNQTAPEQTATDFIVADCPLRRQSKPRILETVSAAGERRFFDKVFQIREDLALVSWDQVIYRKIMQALGYAKNQQPFRRLADLMPYETVCAEMQWVPEEMAARRCEALLFGASGMLPVAPSRRTNLEHEVLAYTEPLVDLWLSMSRRLEIKAMKMQDWQFFRLRPQNFPTRRLAGMVQLICCFFKEGLLRGLLRIVSAHINNMKVLASELEKCLVQSARGFWCHHYNFEGAPDTGSQRKAETLIGKERAKAILLNSLIPIFYLYGEESKDGKLRNVMLHLYGSYPRISENEITRGMVKQLFGGVVKEASFVRLALQQQGLIHLHKLYCKPLRCSACVNLSQFDSTTS